MKKAIVAAATAALIAGGVAADAATNKPPKQARVASKCFAAKSDTLTADTDVRVYSVDLKDGATVSRSAIYACRYKTGKRFLLGVAKVAFDDESTAATQYIRQIRLSIDYGDGVGPGVAYVVSKCTDTCTARVIVRSLRTGKVKMNLKAGGPFDQIALSQPTDQGGFALAWLETSPDGSCESGCKVHLVKKKGDKVLAQGTDLSYDVFGLLDDDGPGIIESGGSNTFIWKQGDSVKVSSFND